MKVPAKRYNSKYKNLRHFTPFLHDVIVPFSHFSPAIYFFSPAAIIPPSPHDSFLHDLYPLWLTLLLVFSSIYYLETEPGDQNILMNALTVNSPLKDYMNKVIFFFIFSFRIILRIEVLTACAVIRSCFFHRIALYEFAPNIR